MPTHLCRLSILFLIFATAQQAVAETSRPNILFIYTDDQSHRTVGCYPEAFDWVKTPNIDTLAQQGVRFSHAYIGAWCMPSRATLLTGHHQHGIESMRMEGEYPGSQYDPQKCRFWPSVFRSQGYQTAHIGKWHTGVDDGFGRDWDHQIVWNRPRFVKNAPNYYYDQMIVKNGGEPKMVKGYTTDNYTDWAIDYINGEGRQADKPWYLWLCYGAVHGPFTPAERHRGQHKSAFVPAPKDVFPPRADKPEYVRKMEYWEPGKDGAPVERKARENSPVGMKDMPGRPLTDWVQQYHEGVLAIDENVGRLLKTLKASGQDENTLIVYTSDQGFAWGQHGFKSKVAAYDATVQAPLIVRPPVEQAESVGGRVVEHPVSGVDLIPTFFRYAGIDLPWKMHGRDLSGLLRHDQSDWAHGSMLVHTAKDYGSKTKSIPAKDDPRAVHGPGVPWYVMFSQGHYKYIRNLVDGEMEELYDLESDPDELKNLAFQREQLTRLRSFRAAAIAELKRTDAPFVDNLPAFSTPK